MLSFSAEFRFAAIGSFIKSSSTPILLRPSDNLGIPHKMNLSIPTTLWLSSMRERLV
jgi:hypothetical protein